jgi:hypothetical protein
VGKWVLQAYDAVVDGVNGSVRNWTLHFILEDCSPNYVWTNRTPANVTAQPAPRFRHASIVVDKSIYVLGGYNDGWLKEDLWRFDVGQWRWTRLTTFSASRALEFIGRAAALTPWGLLAYGGYTSRYNSTAGNAYGFPVYESKVWRQDFSTAKWTQLPTIGYTQRTLPHYHRQEGVFLGPPRPAHSNEEPIGRYLAGVALLLQQSRGSEGLELSLRYRSALGDLRNMSLLMFGGYDGLKYLDDLYELRLDQLSAYDGQETAEETRARYCDWRLLNGTALNAWRTSCAWTRGPAVQTAPCNLTEIVIQAWCRRQWQSVSYL